MRSSGYDMLADTVVPYLPIRNKQKHSAKHT